MSGVTHLPPHLEPLAEDSEHDTRPPVVPLTERQWIPEDESWGLYGRRKTDRPTGRPGAVAWPLSLSRLARWTHKWLGALLALIMMVLSLTGAFLGFKSELEYLQPAARSGAKGDITQVIPPAQVAEIILALQLPEAKTLKDINCIELRPSKRMYKVRLNTSTWRSPREIQVDAMTGAILNNGVRRDELWKDVHSFAVFGPVIKIVTMTVAGLSLLWLSLSGYYLFFYPLWVKSRKRQARRQGQDGAETPWRAVSA